MGADQAPAVIHNAGQLPAFPDIGFPWPIKLIGLAAFAWLLLGPIWVFLAARRGRWVAGIVTYACGAVVAAGLVIAPPWGWAFWTANAAGFPLDEGFARFAAALLLIALWLLGIGGALAGVAALAGHWSMRLAKSLLRRQAGGPAG